MPPMEEIDGNKDPPASSPLPSQQDADALLAKEMAAMSVQEREQSLNDIHGVSEAIHEEPGFVRAKLAEVKMELSKLSTREKEAYMEAEDQNKQYVTCDKFCLKFLRAEMFDARLAAGRMVRFFDEKKKLFGPDKLTKEIELGDLDKEDRKFLESGIGQILPQRDRAGRQIMTWMPMIRGGGDPNRELVMKMKTVYYLVMAASEDEVTQKKGMVSIFVNIGKNQAVSFVTKSWKIEALITSLPSRYSAHHFCVDDTSAASSAFAAIIVLMVGARVRARFRKHEGTWQEIRYELMTFGLPVDALPIEYDVDDFSLDNHIDWLSQREKLEASLDNTSEDTNTWINERPPGPLDVVMGRGLEAQVHPGNLRYRTIIAERQKVYDKSLIYEKTAIGKEIVRLIKESGGRFLVRQEDGHGWKLVDDKAARTKISSAFRDRRKYKSGPTVNAAVKPKSRKQPMSPANKATPFIESGFFDKGMIDTSDTKRLKTSPSP